jgi:hypothetical protein
MTIGPIASPEDLKAGTIGFGPIGGLVGAGVGIGQWMLGEGWTLSQDDKIKTRHVVIITRALSVIEAMPSGARQVPFTGQHWTKDWAWVMPPEDYPGQGGDASFIAEMMAAVHTPYSPLSYAALSAWKFHLPVPHIERWINRRRKGAAGWELPSGRRCTTGLPAEAICSVLADQAWTLAGKKIMRGVPHQCVTPAALARQLRFKTPGAAWGFPGR